MRKHTVIAAAVGIAAVAAAVAIPASAAAPVPGNTAAIPQVRLVQTPGIALANNATTTVTVAGKVGVPADATAVEGILTAYEDTGVSRLVVWDGLSGAPGTPTVIGAKTTDAQPSGASAAFHAALTSGAVKVHNSGAATRFLLTITGYDVPASTPTSPAATTFGVAQLQVDGTTWAQYEAAELGAPGGDMASGAVRFTCKNATDGCNVSLKAFSTADGYSVYPRVILEKESNVDGAKLTCEYADGADNNGATAPLTSTSTTVPLGIGGTADCGGSQTTVSGPVTSINVPGAAGQGIHYDAFTTLTFAKSGS